MAYAFNPFTGTLDYYQAAPVSTTLPLRIAGGATFTAPVDYATPVVSNLVIDGTLRVDGIVVVT